MSGIEVAGVYFSGNAIVPDGFPEVLSPIGLMDISDAILILSEKSISNDLVRLILRKSKHVFLKSIPNLQIREIKELIDLEKEAGIVTFIYNPFNHVPFLDPFANKYERPFFLNLRNCISKNLIRPSHEMILLVSALNRLVQSNLKKIDVFGLQEPENELFINLRIEYDNGCVINLTLSESKLPCYFEIFEKTGRRKFEFETPLFILNPDSNQELAAIDNFIGLIRNQDKKVSSLDNLLNGVQMVNEIREQLRFNEIDF